LWIGYLYLAFVAGAIVNIFQDLCGTRHRVNNKLSWTYCSSLVGELPPTFL